ncbi:hypothetical protein M406DRAFT_342540 [Cryphonectria parasitica EP155]|uniref:P-loop containing nucleoside triphosphate hydrolase protein n=1 Tax=Cryphonectria parasitica (strain ATCC 38755 / EP155) TaxID=660469 RepID=A0A9P5CK26_CRYP1|nr:uncharacterized protein M406DRAFT_342540 [Cryphonectria parasitica EP155]KAF3761839.1 hypothetical protein M406DRAFT_342540 [Cryphonectria parasitica EP155]
MGQQYSQPKPGAKLQVICAGLPRTGTASLSAALEVLLDGPVYHCGTQVFNGPERDIQTALEILHYWPPRDKVRHAENLRLLDSLVGQGYVAVADSPAAGLVPELLELYPEARVLCTTRGVEAWEKSMEGWLALYGETEPPTRKSYHRHVEWMREVVPPGQLFFVDVKDGWDPLCRALSLPVPEGVPFPHINDGKAIEDFLQVLATHSFHIEMV